MSRFSRTMAMGATALSASLIFTGAAFAQDAAEQPQEEPAASDAPETAEPIDQIIVTAQRREQTLQETPVSVAVVQDEQIEKSQIRDAADLQTLVPSLRVAEFAASTNTEFSLRGIGTSSFNPGLEPSVGVFVDGVYYPRTGAAINDLLGIERVEVIRGPQSTLFGRNTPAGVVSFITKEPEFEFGLEGEATVGNYGSRIFKAAVNTPLSDVVAARMDVTFNKNDGFLENVLNGGEINNRDRGLIRGQLLYTPTDRTSIRLIGDYGEIDENCCAAPFVFYDPVDAFAFNALGATLLPPDPFAGDIAVNGEVQTNLEQYGFSGQLDQEFDDFTLTSITAYRRYDERQQIDADFSALDLVRERLINQDYDSFTQEFRVTSTGDNFIDWMGGLFYYNNKLDFSNSTPLGTDARTLFDLASSQQIAPFAGPLAALNPAYAIPPGAGAPTLLERLLMVNNSANVGAVTPLPSGNAALPMVPAEGYLAAGHGLVLEDYDYDTEAYSGFGQLDFNFTDRLTLTLGGRYSHEKKTLNSFVNIDDPISALSFVDLARDLRLVSPSTCDPVLFPIIGGDACAFLVPALLAANGAPVDPTQPLTEEQARNPQFNPFLAFGALQNFPPVPPRPEDRRTDENFSYSAILAYDVTPTLNVYGSYATGFKPGGFNVSYNAAFTGAFEIEDETSRSIEFGAKGSFLDGRFTYATAVFFQEIEDFQANNFVGNGFALDNAGSIEVNGLEFEGLFAPVESLVFTGGFTWLFHNEYGSYEFAPCPDVRGDGTPVWDPSNPMFELCLPGNERVNEYGVRASFNDLSGVDRGTSEFLGAVTGTYTHSFGNGYEGFIRGEAQHTSEFALQTTLDPRPFANQEAYTLFNASVGFGPDDGGWQVQLWGRNLTDEEYVKGGFPSVGFLGASFNQYPGDPLTYGVTLRARY